jgi:hypothetical protein
MSNETDPQTTSDAASTGGAEQLIDVTIPVPAAHLGSFFKAVAVFFEMEHDDEGWRGGRMT